jgi:hypothetical protein
MDQEASGECLNADESGELARLHRENTQLRIKEDILKRPAHSLGMK